VTKEDDMGASKRAFARWASFAAVMLVSIGAPRAQPEAPGICVEIDPSRDTLTEQERQAVRGLVLQAFANEKQAVNSSGTACTETYIVSNIKLGNTITINISGQRGTRSGRSTSLDDLPNVYSQMVKSLITGAPMETGGGATDRTNVTKEQEAPRRVAADSLKYVSLGYGGVIAGRFAYGPAFGFGYRKELDRLALDISGFNILLANDNNDSANDDRNYGYSMGLIQLAGLFYQDPLKDTTLYYGGGISYGFTVVSNGDNTFEGSGMQGHAIAGYEAFRSSTIRGFVQFDLTLPFYSSKADVFDTGTSVGSKYTPTVSLQLGLGWGHSNAVRVINE